MSCVKLDSELLNSTRIALEDIKSQISTAQQNMNESASSKKVSLTASYLKEYETYSVQVKKYDDYGNIVYDEDGNPELVWVRRRRLSKDHTENAKAYNAAIANIGTACGNINSNVVGKISKVIAALNAIEAAVDKFESQENFSLGEVANTDFIYLTEIETIKQSNKQALKEQANSRVDTILREDLADVLVYGSSLNEKLNNNEITLDEYIASLSVFANRENSTGGMGVVESILITTMLSNPALKKVEEEEAEEEKTETIWKDWILDLAKKEISEKTETEISNEFEIIWNDKFNALLEEDNEVEGAAGSAGIIGLTGMATVAGTKIDEILHGKFHKKNDEDEEEDEHQQVTDNLDDNTMVEFGEQVGVVSGIISGAGALSGSVGSYFDKGGESDTEQKVEAFEEKVETAKDAVDDIAGANKNDGNGSTTGALGGGAHSKNDLPPKHNTENDNQSKPPQALGSTQTSVSNSINKVTESVKETVQEKVQDIKENVQSAVQAEEKVEPKQEQKNEETVTSQEPQKGKNEHEHGHGNHREEKIEGLGATNASDTVLKAEPPKEEPVKVDTPKTEESSETIAEGNKTVAGAIAGAATIGATTSVVTGNSGNGGILSNIPTTGTGGVASNIDVPTTVTPNQGTPVSTGNNSMINSGVPTMDNQVADNSSRPTNTTTNTTHTTASSTNPTNEAGTAKNTSSTTATKAPQTAINKVDDDTTTNKSANKHSTKPETAENKEDGKVETKDSGTLGSAQVAVKELEEQYKKEVRIATAVSAGSVLAAAVIKFADLINIIIFLLLLAAIVLLYTTFRVKKKKELDKKIAEVEAQAMIEKDAKKEGISLEEVADASEKVVSSEDLVTEENTEEPKEEVTKEFSDSSDNSSETEVKEKVEEQQVQEVAEAKENEEVELPVSKKESEYVIINQPPVKKEEEK